MIANLLSENLLPEAPCPLLARVRNLGGRALILLAVFGTLSASASLRLEGAPRGEGAEFDGHMRHVRVDLEGKTDAEAITVSAWVKLRKASGTQVFLNRGDRGELFTLYLYKDHIRMLVEYAPGSYAHARAEPPEADTWTHYAGSYDGETIVLFVNGERIDSARAAGRIPERDELLFIGAAAPGLNTVDGFLEDVRIYRTAASASDVRRIFAGEEPAEAARVLRFTGEELEKEARSDLPVGSDGEPQVPFATGKLPTTDGFRGIWYANQSSDDEYRYKYSGGLGTYPQQHHPIAIYAEAVNKTFFTYGGTRKARRGLLHMVSAFDHETGKIARPRILLDKHTTDAHDNPTMSIDGDGYIWIFSNAHGTGRPSYIHRSTEPFSIEAFERKVTTNFSYSQPWFLPEFGFVFLHTRYSAGRVLFVQTSQNGVDWAEPQKLAQIAQGHYQVSWPHGSRVGTVFNYHPEGKGLNYRTNLYYIESSDGGKTWQTVSGESLDVPLTEIDNPARVIDYESQGLIVYLKDISYTEEGHPVLLYLTSQGWQSGPDNDPRTFTTARWTGSDWEVREVTSGDNNYDFGSLYIESDGSWRIVGSTETGPQPYNTGGEMALWRSDDQGESWELVRQLTEDSEYNHTYPRRPLNVHPGFYAFWADGHGREVSPSRFYFATRDGDVFRLPESIEGDADWVDPEPVGR